MTAYAHRFEKAKIGQVDDTSLRVISTFPAASNLQFGVVVKLEPEMLGSNVLFAEPWTFDEYPFGITVYDPTQIDGYYHSNKAANILSFGRIYVPAEVDVFAGEIAYVSTLTGKITNSSSNQNRAIGLFLSSALIGKPAALQFQPSIIR